VAQLAGDLWLAEDCAQEACVAAVQQWPRGGLPANPGGWVVAVARRRALDYLRRESARAGKEREAARELAAAEPDGSGVADDDQLALLFACCHPALDPASRVALTLRVVCGLPAASIAQLLLLPEPTVAQRIVRAKRKVRDADIRLHVPDPGERPGRLASVLRAIYLTFTEGHSPHGTSAVVRDDLCEEALRLARGLHRLQPDEPEVTGLLALILLTSARSAGPADQDGVLVLLADQDRSRWDRGRLDEGRSLVETAYDDAVAAYRDALALEPADAVRRHITGQIAALGAAPAPIKET
jgi:RNA polymerase sigma-70 factor, ECF subfamily